MALRIGEHVLRKTLASRNILIYLAPLTFANWSELPTDQSKSKECACFHGNKHLDRSRPIRTLDFDDLTDRLYVCQLLIDLTKLVGSATVSNLITGLYLIEY